MDQRDISEIKLNVERLEHHFRIYKQDMTEVKDFMQEVKIALAGSNINGNKGLIQLLDKLNSKVETIEDENILLKEHMRAGKFIAGVLITALISLMFMVISESTKL
jgi:O-phosphoseryl-tRNA(Cys) synthetase